MAWPSKRALVRFWRPFRVVAGLVLLGIAGWVVAGKSSELAGAGAFLAQLRWGWLVLGGAAELASFLSMAALQRSLLKAGQTRARVRRVALITFAGNAIESALPVGAAFAGVYQFRQYELLGADEVLAAWVVIATAGVVFTTLAALAGVGLALAASTGTTFDLVEAIIGVIVITLAVVIAWMKRAELYGLAQKAVRALESHLHRPAGQLSGPLAGALERMRSVAPSPREWARSLVWGSGVWLADCACLLFAFIAVGAPVPWQGLLLAYCGGQLAVSLPITPGGLGVVEGSLTVALVAFGGGQAATVAAVLLYRVISFWIPLPVGAGCYVVLMGIRRRLTHQRGESGKEPKIAAKPGSGEELESSEAGWGGENGRVASTSPAAGGPAPVPGDESAHLTADEPGSSAVSGTKTTDIAGKG
ncbi:MAG: lysylphosphatidylglycerol synthase transmembrane domain-containing protein [Acidimicrobiales bacterium]